MSKSNRQDAKHAKRNKMNWTNAQSGRVACPRSYELLSFRFECLILCFLLGALGLLAVNRSSFGINPSQALNAESPLGFNVEPSFKESVGNWTPNSRKRAAGRGNRIALGLYWF
jgi:hypothetical protein